MQSHHQKMLLEFVDDGRLEWVSFDAKFFSQQIESCLQSRIDELVPAGLPKSYDDLRVMRNEIEYSTSELQYADHRHVNLSIEIDDQLLAIAQSISS